MCISEIPWEWPGKEPGRLQHMSVPRLQHRVYQALGMLPGSLSLIGEQAEYNLSSLNTAHTLTCPLILMPSPCPPTCERIIMPNLPRILTKPTNNGRIRLRFQATPTMQLQHLQHLQPSQQRQSKPTEPNTNRILHESPTLH